MIFINNSPEIPKKFSTITNAINGAYEDISNTVYWLLGEGLVNFGTDQLNESTDFRLAFSYNPALNKYIITFKYVNTEKDLKMSFAESDKSKAYLSSLKGNSFYSHALVFDDKNLVSASTTSKVSLPLRNLVATNVNNYSSEYFSSIYVNGYPQPTTSIDYAPDEQANTLKVGFSSIYGGAIFPDPVDTNKNFSEFPILGATPQEWSSTFVKNFSSYVEMRVKFSNANVYKSPRFLIFEIVDLATQQTSYLNVPKNISADLGVFYYIDSLDEDTVVISIDKGSDFYDKYFLSTSGSTQTRLKLMFLSPLENISPFTANFSGLSRKYQLPYKNLTSPDAITEIKVLAYDSATETVSDISLLNSSLLGSLFSIDYENGVLEILNILAGQITSTTSVFAYNIKYNPPVQIDYTGDFSSNISIYGTHGSTYVIENTVDEINNRLNMPKTLYLWAYLKEVPKKYSPIIDSSGYLSSINQYTELELTFFITLNNEYTDILTTTNLTYQNTKPINIGYLNLRKPTEDSTDPVTAYYIFKLNPNLLAPYERYKSLLKTFGIYFLDYKVFKTDKAQQTLPVKTISGEKQIQKYYKVAYLPKDTEILEFYGYLGRNKIVLDDTGNVSVLKQFVNGAQYSYTATLKVVDAILLEESERLGIAYTGEYIDLYDLVNSTGGVNISSEYIELVSKDISESTIFAPKVLAKEQMDAIENKCIVLDFKMLTPDSFTGSAPFTSVVCSIDTEFYFKFIPRIVNYVNTL